MYNSLNISRSKLELFIECPRCFYLNIKLGLKRPDSPPFALNNAVDKLLKKEFDYYRYKKIEHPIMKKYNINALPAILEELKYWRDDYNNFKGLLVTHKELQITLNGIIDDLWVSKDKNEYIIVDYKATNKNRKIDTFENFYENPKYSDIYKRQIEMYQWMLRKLIEENSKYKNYTVSDSGYLVVCNAQSDQDTFNEKLHFETTILEHIGNTDWIEKTLYEVRQLIDSNKIPDFNDKCKYCKYLKNHNEIKK